jgi:hypothetical protein
MSRIRLNARFSVWSNSYAFARTPKNQEHRACSANSSVSNINFLFVVFARGGVGDIATRRKIKITGAPVLTAVGIGGKNRPVIKTRLTTFR